MSRMWEIGIESLYGLGQKGNNTVKFNEKQFLSTYKPYNHFKSTPRHILCAFRVKKTSPSSFLCKAETK